MEELDGGLGDLYMEVQEILLVLFIEISTVIDSNENGMKGERFSMILHGILAFTRNPTPPPRLEFLAL